MCFVILYFCNVGIDNFITEIRLIKIVACLDLTIDLYMVFLLKTGWACRRGKFSRTISRLFLCLLEE